MNLELQIMDFQIVKFSEKIPSRRGRVETRTKRLGCDARGAKFKMFLANFKFVSQKGLSEALF